MADLEARIAKLEAEIPHIYHELKEIKKHLDNDIPHQIAAVQKSVGDLSRHYNDLDAISRFVALLFKIVVMVLSALWTVKGIWPKLFSNGH